MNNLITLSQSKELVNKKFRQKLSVMVTAERDEGRASWRYAKSLNDIVTDDMYSDDFESKKAFADAIGISAGRISQCVGAIKFIEKHSQFTNITVESAYLINSLSIKEDGKKVNKTEEFLDWLDDNSILLERCTVKELKKHIKEYKDEFSNVVDVESDSADSADTAGLADSADSADSADTADTADTAETTLKDRIIINIIPDEGYKIESYNGVEYTPDRKELLKTIARKFGFEISAMLEIK